MGRAYEPVSDPAETCGCSPDLCIAIGDEETLRMGRLWAVARGLWSCRTAVAQAKPISDISMAAAENWSGRAQSVLLPFCT